jgi:hypothetical protein
MRRQAALRVLALLRAFAGIDISPYRRASRRSSLALIGSRFGSSSDCDLSVFFHR